jgi:hypothetical protein
VPNRGAIGHVYRCPSCQLTRYSYHSCRNRHCPTCQQEATQAWLAEQPALLVPVPDLLVTFRLPSELHAIARAHPETIYPHRSTRWMETWTQRLPVRSSGFGRQRGSMLDGQYRLSAYRSA